MPRTTLSPRRKLLFIALGAIGLLSVGGIAAAVVLLSGAYSTAATKQHFRLTYRILEMGLHFSVRANARHIVVPNLEQTDRNVGAACYRQHCQQCHGAPGIARDALGRGQLPSPSALVQSAREWPAAHLFYVTQKGVRMSGMPAWEYRISNAGLWSTVAFLQAMPSMTRRQYATLIADAAATVCPLPTDVQPYSKARAQTLLRQYACENCHVIDGLVGPRTHVGPSLQQFDRRRYIAGVLPNTHENLTRWIVAPDKISPMTLMPDLQVSEAHARDMAQYLLGDPGTP